MSSNFTIFPFDMLLLKSFPLLHVSSSTSIWDVFQKTFYTVFFDIVTLM